MTNFLMGDGTQDFDDKEAALAAARQRQRDFNEQHIKQLQQKHPIQNQMLQLLPRGMQENYWRNYGVDDISNPNQNPRLMYNNNPLLQNIPLPQELVAMSNIDPNILLQFLPRGQA